MQKLKSRSTEGNGGSDNRQISQDTVFHLLRNRRRRYAIHYLKRAGSAEIGDVAEQVAAWENDVPVEAVDSTQRKRVYNSLQQTHLPELDDQGFADYDTRSGTVELTDAAHQLDVYLEVVPDRDIPWSEYYLGLSAVGAGLVAAVWAQVFPFTLLPAVAWMAFLVGAFAFSAVANFYDQRRSLLGGNEVPPEVRRREGSQ